MSNGNILKSGISLLLFAGVWLWMWLGVPEYLLYQEQYQLFLWSSDYLAGRIVVPGGFADWLGEFVVQFYYVPLYGALLSASVLTLTQILLGAAFRKSEMRCTAYALAAMPPILYLASVGDENTLFSSATAMMLAAGFIFMDSLRNSKTALADSAALSAGFVVLYWLGGPVAFIYVAVCGIMRKSPVATLVALTAGLASVWLGQKIFFEQYPLYRLLTGLNYYRIPEVWPSSVWMPALCFLLPAVVSLCKAGRETAWWWTAVAAGAVIALVFVPSRYDSDKSRVLQYDSLVRQGRWGDIMEKSRKDPPSDPFCIQAQNLALGMTGNMTDSMFEYPQCGPDGLIGEGRLDNTTPLVTAEVLYRLGLTNIAFSTTFDLQESIMNDRKSGRFMKRLAECSIINGNYDVAAKYIGYLKKSLYYAGWAKEAEKLIGDDGNADRHPVYGPLRRAGFRRVAFYDHSQTDKILAMAALDNEEGNRLAWQYFCGTAMLNGDLNTLIGVYNSAGSKYDNTRIPRHVQEAMAMYWTSGHSNFDGIPFTIDSEVRRQTMQLAQTVSANPGSPAAWQKVAPGTFSLYFLNQMSRPRVRQQSNQSSTHE